MALSAFVVDGLANGAILFGRPTDAGTMANIVVACVIGLALYLGRGGLQPATADGSTKP